MRHFILCLMIGGALAVSAAAEQKKPAAGEESKTLTIPADAVEAGPSTWKYTDRDGKKWIYRKTPFGVVRVEDVPESEKPVPAGPEQRTKSWKVTDLGDKVAFENASPFGPQKWTKKKSELNEDEKAALARAQRETPGSAAKTAKTGDKK